MDRQNTNMIKKKMNQTHRNCKRCKQSILLCNERIRQTGICSICVKYLVPDHVPKEQQIPYLKLIGYDNPIENTMTNRVKCVICNNIKVPYSQRIRETGVCFSCTRRIIPKHIPQSQHIKYLKTKGYNKKPKYLRCKRCKRCNKLVILCNNKIRETCICFQCVKYLVPNHIPEEKH